LIQKNLLNKKDTLTVESATKFLEDRGFFIEKFDSNIPRLQLEIIQEFYKNLKSVIGERRLSFLNVQDKEDLKAIDRFIKKSSRLGITKVDSLNYLKEVVGILFSEYNNLGLRQPPTSLSFLLSHNGNWIIDKLLVILDTKVKNYENSPEAVAYKESIYEIEDETFKDLQKKRHKELLEDKGAK
jgi:hypothetical protein